MKYIKDLLNVIKNRDLSVEERVSIMFISSGVISAVIGMIICIACHASIISLIAVSFIAILAIITIGIGIKNSDIDFIRKIMVWTVSIMIPIVFLTAGGLLSGCTAWLIFELVYVALACRNKRLALVLTLDSIIAILLMVADYIGMPFIYHLKADRDVFISVFGSIIVVAASILITVYLYKKLYNDERNYLEEQQKELQRANQFARNFLASMSHELRTPVNSIMGFNNFILQNEKEGSTYEYSLDVKHATELLMVTIDDIFDFSGIELGKMSLDVDSYQLKDLILSCFHMISPSAKSKGLTFHLDVDTELPQVLKGDSKRIKQIILNLLTNALKYTEKGNITFSVGLNKRSTECDTKSLKGQMVGLVIKISDEGIGIADDIRENMFTALSAEFVGNSESAQGKGLGLTITKRLVDLMKGDIIVESTVGQGSVFTVILPQEVIVDEKIGRIVDVHNEIVKNQDKESGQNENVTNSSESTQKGKTISNTDSEQKENTATGSEAEQNKEDSKKLILVVDDTAMNLKLMKLILKNYDVTTVDRGAKAIDACLDKRYALILMDIMMPEMDGVEAMKAIRKECYSDVPVIAVTADAVAGAREEYLAEGFNDYVSKPVMADTLMSVIEKYL